MAFTDYKGKFVPTLEALMTAATANSQWKILKSMAFTGYTGKFVPTKWAFFPKIELGAMGTYQSFKKQMPDFGIFLFNQPISCAAQELIGACRL